MDDRLDRELRALGATVAFPPTPDLRDPVRRRIAEAEPRRRTRPVPLVRRSLVLAVLATLLLVAAAAAAAFLLPGLRLTIVPSLPSPAADTLATRLALGSRIDVGPDLPGVPRALGAPEAAYRSEGGEVLSLVYRADDTLPALGSTDIGLIVQVIDGALDGPRVEKLATEFAVEVVPVEIAGSEGYWISGEPHLVRYIGPGREDRAQSTRVVGDTLVWERNGRLFRIESGLGREATVALAETIRP